MKIKTIKISLLSLILSLGIIFGFSALAQTTPTNQPDLGSSLPNVSNPLNINLSVQIPTLGSLSGAQCDKTSCATAWLGEYINALYKYGIGIISILAIIVMMLGGILWITAGGREERITDAKQWITGGLMGLLIVFSSYIILNIINPALTVLSPIKLAYVQRDDLEEISDSLSKPITNSNFDCPAGKTTIPQLVDYYTKQQKMKYSQAQRGDCQGDTCYCDCSYFAEFLGSCAKLPSVSGEGTTAGLFLGSGNGKKLITDCNAAASALKPGDLVGYNDGSKGHVLTYIGNGQTIECGGGNTGQVLRVGAIQIADFKTRCESYVHGSHKKPFSYISR